MMSMYTYTDEKRIFAMCSEDVSAVPCISNGTPHNFAIEAVLNCVMTIIENRIAGIYSE